MAEHGAKRCTRCHLELPLSEFGTHLRKNRISGKRYTYPICRVCKNAAHDPLRARKSVLRTRYKLSWEQFEALLASQGYGCAVCGATEPGGKGHWHIDHDHSCCPTRAGSVKTCGRCVRGALCHLCNTALGCARDSVEVLEQMIDYLNRSKVRSG